MSSSVIGELAVNAVVRTEGVERGSRAARTEISSLAAFATKAGGALATMGTAAAIAGYNLVESQGQIADSTDRATRKLDLSVEQLSRYRYAAKMAAEMSDETLDGALERMNTNIGLAAHGAGRAGKSIEELGLSAEYLGGLSTDRKIGLISDALSHVENSADRVRLAEKIFGDGNFALVLEKGRAGLAELGDESDRTGATLYDLANKKLGDADNSLDRMHKSIDGAKHALGGALAPAVAEVADGITQFVAAFREIPPRVTEAEVATQLHTDALERQKQVLAKVNEEWNKRAAFGGDKDRAVANAAAADREYKKLQSDKASLQGEIDAARRGNEQFGMSDLDKAKDNRAHHMVNRDLNDGLIAELETREKLEATRQAGIAAQEHEQRLQERAAAIIEQNLTPLEELQKKLAEIQELTAAGKLSPAEAMKAAQAARNGFSSSVGSGGPAERHAPLAGLKFGSSEAMRAIAESRNQGKDKVPEQQLKELQEGNKLTQKMIDKLEADKPFDLATWS